MDIRFLGKNLAISQGIRDHMREKITKLEKYAQRLLSSHVVLRKEKYLYDAQITLLTKNFQAYGEACRKENIYAAIDQACERVEKQLKKFREKVKDHHKESSPKTLRPAARSGPGPSGEEVLAPRKPAILDSRAFVAPKPMSAEEASLQLEIVPDPFHVFLNARTRKVSVIFKREDGNHGLIEPEF